ALVVVGLWASVAGGAILWMRDRNADDQRARSAAGLVAGDTGSSTSIDATAGTTSPDSTVDDAGAGDGADGAGDIPGGGGAVPDGGGDGPDAGYRPSPGGGGDTPAPGAETDDTVVVRGTVDLDGEVTGVTITPSPMSLQDVAVAEAAAFAFAGQPLIRKIWSARAGFGGPTIQLAQSEAVPAGP